MVVFKDVSFYSRPNTFPSYTCCFQVQNISHLIATKKSVCSHLGTGDGWVGSRKLTPAHCEPEEICWCSTTSKADFQLIPWILTFCYIHTLLPSSLETFYEFQWSKLTHSSSMALSAGM